MFLVRLGDRDHPLRLMSFKSNPWLKFEDPENEEAYELNQSKEEKPVELDKSKYQEKPNEEEEKDVEEEDLGYETSKNNPN